MQRILINADGSDVRLGLRVYFTLILILIGFIGDWCCALRVRLRLHRLQVVELPQMTGWLSGSRFAYAVASLRAAPAGWLSLVMLLVTVLGFVSDLAVSGLVVSTQVVDRCHFNTTGVYSTLSDDDFGLKMGVANAGVLYDLVLGAQATSQLNGGIDGIYQKVNSDLTFRAQKRDTVGQWECNSTGEERTFPASYNTTENMDTIGEALEQEGLLFADTWRGYWDNSGSGPRGYFIWSSSTYGDVSGLPWTVRAAVQMSLNTSEPKQMRIFSCAMNAPSLEWLLPLIETQALLETWGPVVQANMYPMFQVVAKIPAMLELYPGKVIASKLNAAMMVGGQSWGNSVSPRTVDDPTQGCLALRTLVPWSVAALFFLTALLTVGLTTYLIALQLLIGSARKSNPHGYISAINESTPNDLLSWMRQATEETNQKPLKAKRSRSWYADWRFGPLNNGNREIGLIYSPEIVEQSGLPSRTGYPALSEQYLLNRA